jgi:hypothetical protein
LRKEHIVHHLDQVRAHLFDGIGSHRNGRLHHQAGIANHLFAGVFLQELAGNQAGRCKPGQEYDNQYKIELEPEPHTLTPSTAEHHSIQG